jgi:hypothetical protein
VLLPHAHILDRPHSLLGEIRNIGLVSDCKLLSLAKGTGNFMVNAHTSNSSQILTYRILSPDQDSTLASFCSALPANSGELKGAASL